MGIKLFSDSSKKTERSGVVHFSDDPQDHSHGTVSGHDDLFTKLPTRDGNPNKYRYNIVRTMRIGKVVVAMINYPDCFNWSGNKICVYDDADKFLSLNLNKCIDPHFLEKEYSPIARFEPTPRGWDLAVNFAKILNKDIIEEEK